MDQSRTYISSRNRNLAKLAILRQPSLEETAARPMPAHIPGQLSLFIDYHDGDDWRYRHPMPEQKAHPAAYYLGGYPELNRR